MAGRGGYSRQSSSSLRPEQLQNMGVMGKDMPSAIVAPPPTFPPLINRPALLKKTAERDFMIDWKEDFLAYLRNSPYYTGASAETKHLHSRTFLESSVSENGAFNWAHMPSELRPNWKRKLIQIEGGRKMVKDVNIEETLKALEQKEKSKRPGGAPNNDETKEGENEEIEDEEQGDEEMDDDNDYLAQYFDDGGNYLDEDDNMDDGPIY